MFDTISLALPLPHLGAPLLLQQCLDKFVSSEIIHEFTCEACTQTVQMSKKLTFAKLPHLLCFHVQRLVWMSDGNAVKRHDHVGFPEFLNMDKYSYTGRYMKAAKKQRLSAAGDQIGLVGGKKVVLGQCDLDESGLNIDLSDLTSATTIDNLNMEAKHRYRLQAVVSHLGTNSSGHFVCYRRAPVPNDYQWYYTSDCIVRRVTFKDVLNVNAYMLFYERLK